MHSNNRFSPTAPGGADLNLDNNRVKDNSSSTAIPAIRALNGVDGSPCEYPTSPSSDYGLASSYGRAPHTWRDHLVASRPTELVSTPKRPQQHVSWLGKLFGKTAVVRPPPLSKASSKDRVVVGATTFDNTGDLDIEVAHPSNPITVMRTTTGTVY
eukprot:Selendium_serpulae@DN9341_c0_g1_i1.p1